MIVRSTFGIGLGLVFAAGLGGCYTPSGGLFPSGGGPLTYYSTETSPKTVKIIDMRSMEEVFVIDIPAGKQLVLDFDKGGGDDPVNTPDLLRYEVNDIGTTAGTLHNAMTVPNGASRRIDVYLRQAPEYAGGPPQRALRSDEVANRPDWWTPKGGPMPENKARNLYDR